MFRGDRRCQQSAGWRRRQPAGYSNPVSDTVSGETAGAASSYATGGPAVVGGALGAAGDGVSGTADMITPPAPTCAPGYTHSPRRLLPSQVARLLTLCPAGRLGHAHISLRQRSAAKEAVGIFLPMDKLVIPAYAGTQGQATEIPGFPPSRERRL
jgi:hypothetical protein